MNAMLEKLTRAGVDKAALPAVYENAQRALAECYEIDECMSWADKAAALASYARQIDDNTLLDLAKKIRARAIRQAGLLLKEVGPSPGGQPTHSTRDGAGPSRNEDENPTRDGAGPSRSAREGDYPSTRKQVAADAGMSERQAKTALRVANIPHDEFEAQIESAHVPTVSELAAQGTKRKEHDLEGVDPEDYIAGIKLIGLVNHVRREGAAIDIAQGIRGVRPSEVTVLRSALDDAFRVLRGIQSALDAYPGDQPLGSQQAPAANDESFDANGTLWI